MEEWRAHEPTVLTALWRSVCQHQRHNVALLRTVVLDGLE